MTSRGEQLRIVLESSGAIERLSEARLNGLIARFERDVEERIAGGTPESEAVAQAIGEMLRAVPPPGAPPAATAFGLTLAAWVLLLIFVVLQLFVTPHFAQTWAAYRMQLPLPTELLITTSAGMRQHWVAVLAAVAFLGWGFFFFRSARPTRMIGAALVVLMSLVLLVALLGLCLPMMELQRAVG